MSPDGHLERVPALVARVHVGVAAREHLGLHRVLDRVVDLALRRPDVAQVDRLAVGALAERLGGEVDVHAAGERVGDHQRRRGEVVHLHLGVDPALEVPVARQHRRDRQVPLLDRRRDLLRQRAGVPDAGRAAVADEVEAERSSGASRPEALVVVGHDLRTRREAGLHPRLRAQSAARRRCGRAGRRPPSRPGSRCWCSS